MTARTREEIEDDIAGVTLYEYLHNTPDPIPELVNPERRKLLRLCYELVELDLREVHGQHVDIRLRRGEVAIDATAITRGATLHEAAGYPKLG